MAGKGEKIEKKKHKKKVEKIDATTQVNSYTIEFELSHHPGVDNRDIEENKRSSDCNPIPTELAAELIDRLEDHKRNTESRKNIELAFENDFHLEPSPDRCRD